MCIGWMKPLFEPTNRSFTVSHHRRLWVAAELIPSHIGRTRQGKCEPEEQEVVDGLDQH